MSSEPVIPPGSQAVLIGVPHYRDARYKSYAAVGNSVEGMRTLLVESGLCGWRKDQVITIPDPENSGRLLRYLRRLARDTSGVLLLYFVGHGVLSEHGELCLAIADTDHDDPDATGLEYEKIKRMLHSGTPAATRIAILDCCYSGRGIGLGPAGPAQLADLSQTSGAYTLTAADDFAAVPPDDTSAARTAFTGELLDLLALGIPGGPPDLTLGVIFPVLRQRLAARGLPRPNQRSDDSAAAYIFARNSAPAAPAASPDEQPLREHPMSPGGPPRQPIQPPGMTEPPPVHPVTLRVSPRQQAVNLCAPLAGLVILIAMLTTQSAIPGARPDHAELITLSVVGVTVIAAIVIVLRLKLVLTSQGVSLTRVKTTHIRWSDIEGVQVHRRFGRRHDPRIVSFVLGDGSKISSWVPVDDRRIRDDQFDQKAWTIQQWHTQLGSSQRGWPGGVEHPKEPAASAALTGVKDRRVQPTAEPPNTPHRMGASYICGVAVAAGCFIAANFLPFGSGYWTSMSSGVQTAQVTLYFSLGHPLMRQAATGPDSAKVYTAWWLAPFCGIGTAVILTLAVVYPLLLWSAVAPETTSLARQMYAASRIWVSIFALILVTALFIVKGPDVPGLSVRDVPQSGGWLLFAASVILTSTLRRTKRHLAQSWTTRASLRPQSWNTTRR